MAKIETAAQKYRNRDKQEQLHEVTCSCGAAWKCRRVSMQFWITSGTMPAQLVAKSVAAAKKANTTPNDLVKEMTPDEFVKSIEFSSKVVQYTAVSPRIVETVTGPDDLAHDEVDMCCYETLLNWQMKGGDEAQALETFRAE